MRRLRTRAQFQALLRQAPVARTRHFALHWRGLGEADARESADDALFVPAAMPWLGAMAPKRWARRAVTRNTIRRQIYAVGADLEPPLTAGAYLVRLRAAFAPAQYPSATSAALRRAVRQELQQLFAQVVV
ncbi:MAG: ribonuclease P protein component [Pseudomonadota bacterium]|nr:ribonuclease P protein component [Pseudomonadota bacterium]